MVIHFRLIDMRSFIESEVINYMGERSPKEEIAAGVIDSVATKVVTLCQKKAIANKCTL